ncbi:MAG: class I SAM-dependent methyltransferase [Bacteroidota bacterium]
MKKLDQHDIINQYRSGIASYKAFTNEVGLWASEKWCIKRYFKTTDHLLDLGCGTGRTTFGLWELGYRNLIAVDLTPEMIESAVAIQTQRKSDIPFQVGDATALALETDQFDAVLFSFNGLMSIPGQHNRDNALSEIKRVLKPGGIFLFTTHDRDEDADYFEFWKAQRERWDRDEQDKRLYEFGDIITTSKNESREIFIHIPDSKEIETWLHRFNFQVLESFYRIDRFEESEAVKAKSGECRFWVAQANGIVDLFQES